MRLVEGGRVYPYSRLYNPADENFLPDSENKLFCFEADADLTLVMADIIDRHLHTSHAGRNGTRVNEYRKALRSAVLFVSCEMVVAVHVTLCWRKHCSVPNEQA